MLAHPLAGPKPVTLTKYALCLLDRLDMIERPSMVPGARDDWYYCTRDPDQLGLGVTAFVRVRLA